MKDTFPLFFFSMLASGVNYAFQIMLGNMLSLTDFGNFNAINSLLSNILCVYSPLAVYLCRVSAEHRENLAAGKSIFRKVFRFTVGISIAAFFLELPFFFSQFSRNLGLESLPLQALFAALFLISGLYTVINGIFQGIDRLAWYGFMGFLLALLRLLFSYLGITLRRQIQAVLWAMLISFAAVTSFIVWMVKKHAKCSVSKNSMEHSICNDVSYRQIFHLYGAAFAAQMLVSLYVNGGEIILMKNLYDSEAVGRYTLASTIAKVGVYVISIFTTALLPSITAEWTAGRNVRKKFVRSVLLCLLLDTAWIFFLMTVGKSMIPRILGGKYQQAFMYIQYMGIWVIGIGELLMINTFYLAISRLREYLFVLASTTIVTIFVLICSRIDIIHVPVVIGIGTMFILLFSCRDSMRWNDQIQERKTIQYE